MSSNQKYNRVCEWCNKVFVAQTKTTKYCTKSCNDKAYKHQEREKKQVENNIEFHQKSQEFDMEILKKKRYLTVKEACAYCSCSRSTLYRLREMGILPQIGIGRKVLFHREDLDEMMGGFTTLENS